MSLVQNSLRNLAQHLMAHSLLLHLAVSAFKADMPEEMRQQAYAKLEQIGEQLGKMGQTAERLSMVKETDLEDVIGWASVIQDADRNGYPASPQEKAIADAVLATHKLSSH